MAGNKQLGSLEGELARGAQELLNETESRVRTFITLDYVKLGCGYGMLGSLGGTVLQRVWGHCSSQRPEALHTCFSILHFTVRL